MGLHRASATVDLLPAPHTVLVIETRSDSVVVSRHRVEPYQGLGLLVCISFCSFSACECSNSHLHLHIIKSKGNRQCSMTFPLTGNIRSNSVVAAENIFHLLQEDAGLEL